MFNMVISPAKVQLTIHAKQNICLLFVAFCRAERCFSMNSTDSFFTCIVWHITFVTEVALVNNNLYKVTEIISSQEIEEATLSAVNHRGSVNLSRDEI